jgi:hypothetical protein
MRGAGPTDAVKNGRRHGRKADLVCSSSDQNEDLVSAADGNEGQRRHFMRACTVRGQIIEVPSKLGQKFNCKVK